ncbi:MAG TPA: glycosyltransferase family 4 protein [Gemmatimonadaceae bacterium]|nr:glycosyltransferase family 4 protein [Gemmatimonadaceae bacterium]
MRIIQVSPYSWDAPGGVQIHISQLTRHLQQRGHEVLVLAPGDEPGLRGHVHIIGRTFTMGSNGSTAQISVAPRAMRALARAMRDFAPDVVHVHEPFAPGIGIAATKHAPAPVVGTFHSYYPRETSTGRLYTALAPLLRPTWNRVHQRIAVSRAARHSAKGRMGKGDVKILPNGIEVERFATADPARDVPAGRKLLFVGRLDPRKGLPFAMRAFVKLAPRYPDLSLVVVGSGPQRDAIREVPAELRDRVQMKGKVSYQALPTYYRASDIFVSPATGAESFGIVLVEAMAAGLPVVASDIPGYRDVARDGRESLLVAPSNADALAEGIAHLLDRPEECARLGANGALRAQAYAWDNIIDELELVYERLAGIPRRIPVLAEA